jgi:hypothetical protein
MAMMKTEKTKLLLVSLSFFSVILKAVKAELDASSFNNLSIEEIFQKDTAKSLT